MLYLKWRVVETEQRSNAVFASFHDHAGGVCALALFALRCSVP